MVSKGRAEITACRRVDRERLTATHLSSEYSENALKSAESLGNIDMTICPPEEALVNGYTVIGLLLSACTVCNRVLLIIITR